MGVDADEERAVDAGTLAVIADRLADGEDVVLVEGIMERGAAMAGGAEGEARRPARLCIEIPEVLLSKRDETLP
jgi:hypothetical protein